MQRKRILPLAPLTIDLCDHLGQLWAELRFVSFFFWSSSMFGRSHVPTIDLKNQFCQISELHSSWKPNLLFDLPHLIFQASSETESASSYIVPK
jgi:hypothetical protein